MSVLALISAAAQTDGGFFIGAGAAMLESGLGGTSAPGTPGGTEEVATAIKVFNGYEFELPVFNPGVELGYSQFAPLFFAGRSDTVYALWEKFRTQYTHG